MILQLLLVELSVAATGRAAGAGLGLLASAHIELDWNVVERQLFPKHIQQVPLVGRVEQSGAVDEQDNGRRIGADLGGIVDPGSPVLGHGRGMGLDGLPQHAVQCAGADPPVRLLVERLAEIQQCLDVLAGLGRDEGQRHVAHVAECMLHDVGESRHVALRRVVPIGQHEVPLVDREDTGLVFLGDVIGQLLVQPSDALSGVDQHQNHIGPADRPLGAVNRIKIEAVTNLGLALDPGGIDGEKRKPVEFEMDVDRVARGSRPLRDDHPLGVGQGVDECRLPRVGPAHHGDLHDRLGRLCILAAGQHLLDHLEQSLAIPVLLARDRNRLAATEFVKFSAPLIDLGVIGLVHDQDDRRLEIPQPLGNFLVQWHQLFADVHHEEDQAGLVQGRIDLPVHILAQIVAVNHADAAGVDQLEEPRILVVAELDECTHPVAGDARQSINDRDPSPRQPVQKRRLADIGPTHDHDLGQSHASHLIDGSRSCRISRKLVLSYVNGRGLGRPRQSATEPVKSWC